MLAEFDLHAPTPDEKHLILVLVMVPWEHPAELRERPLSLATTLGRQCSWISANFSVSD
jgi:hypothetical protein